MTNQPATHRFAEGLAGARVSPQPVREADASWPVPLPVQATVVGGSEGSALFERAWRKPVPGRELLAVTLLVALADIAIYRGAGFSGCAALFAAAPVLLALGARRPRRRAAVWWAAALMWLLAAKLVWCGHFGLIAAGFGLIVAMSMALAGLTPYISDRPLYAAQTLPAGCLGLWQYARSARKLGRGIPRGGWVAAVLPLIALVTFGSLFLLANPDLVTSFVSRMRQARDSLGDWLARFAPSFDEILFWAAAAWLTVGLLRPLVRRSVLRGRSRQETQATLAKQPRVESPFYAAFRNTLLAVIVLFAVYLVFEFKTLWFQKFPPGFYYAGYAHQGAAWLTAALGLSTAVLSLVFRGSVLAEPRLPRLRRLAWLWSAENVVLALAVYNRMHIYVEFNGMSRMRVVGLFGITAVLVGFWLVIGKIVRSHDFVWLVQRHLWTLAAALVLLAVTPVDLLVHSYNVRRVLAGDLAPVVQISVHPISSEGVLVLQPLVHSGDPAIREGIRAMLAARAEQLQAEQRLDKGWTAFQFADHVLLERLQAMRSEWQPYTDPARRATALARFHQYAYQWY